MDATEIGDRLDIDQLLVRYSDAIDGKDWDLLDTVFTADAYLDYREAGGPDAAGDYTTMRAWLEGALTVFKVTQHMVGKSAMSIAGDVAHCRTMFHNPNGIPVDQDGMYDPDGSELHMFTVGGWYRDRCVRTPDGWRISEKVEEVAFMHGGFPPTRPPAT